MTSDNFHLAELLASLCHVESVMACRSFFYGHNWILTSSTAPSAMLHYVVSGSAKLLWPDVDGSLREEAVHQGDVVLVSQGNQHSICAPELSVDDISKASLDLRRTLTKEIKNGPFLWIHRRGSGVLDLAAGSGGAWSSTATIRAPLEGRVGGEDEEEDEDEDKCDADPRAGSRLVSMSFDIEAQELRLFGQLPATIKIQADDLQMNWLWEALNQTCSPEQATRIISSGGLCPSAPNGIHRTAQYEPGLQLVLQKLTEISLLQLFLHWQHTSSLNVGAAIRDDALKFAAEAFFDAPSHPWPNHQLAAVCGLSESAFTRRWKACTGSTPQRSFRNLRLVRARKLIADGMSLERAAEVAGLNEARIRLHLDENETTNP